MVRTEHPAAWRMSRDHRDERILRRFQPAGELLNTKLTVLTWMVATNLEISLGMLGKLLHS